MCAARITINVTIQIASWNAVNLAIQSAMKVASRTAVTITIKVAMKLTIAMPIKNGGDNNAYECDDYCTD